MKFWLLLNPMKQLFWKVLLTQFFAVSSVLYRVHSKNVKLLNYCENLLPPDQQLSFIVSNIVDVLPK